jgi:hypothetical protein
MPEVGYHRAGANPDPALLMLPILAPVPLDSGRRMRDRPLP